MSSTHEKRFTGYHAAAILVLFFGVIMAVNFTMARYATATFGGVVVQNSYVASQEYNSWLEQAEVQESWGWTVASKWQDDGRIAVVLSDVPGTAGVSGVARHPLGRKADQPLEFVQEEGGTFVSKQAVPVGRWTLRLQVQSGEKAWRGEETLR